MRKSFTLSFLSMIVLMFTFTFNSSASLVQTSVNGDPILIDDSNNLIWLTNWNMFSNLTWYEVDNSLDILNYAGIDKWRLAAPSEISSLVTEYNTYYQSQNIPFNTIFEPIYSGFSQPGPFDRYVGWSSSLSIYAGGIPYASVYDLIQFSSQDLRINQAFDQNYNTASIYRYAWVSTDISNYNPVPLPPTILLLGFGLFGLVGVRKMTKN
jgi:hypothetical protein